MNSVAFLQNPRASATGGRKKLRPPFSSSNHRRAGIAALLFFMLAGLALAGPAKTPADKAKYVVAIGDVHGDFDDFVSMLQLAGLIDAQHHWTGDQTTLVQVGDLLDRGPKPREVMDLVISLEKEAPKAGGRVVPLLGNHEMMNIMGDLRYVTAENYAAYADSNSAERQKSAYQEYVKWRSSHAQLLAELPQPMELTEAEWMARHPLGFVEQREAVGPNGSYGKWLRFDSAKQGLVDQKVILPFFTLQEITAAVQAELSAERKSQVPSDQQKQARLVGFLGYGDWLSVRVDGPLWFRGYDQWSEEEGAAQIGKVLESYNAKRIVVGHTVQKGGRMRNRFGNRVFLIDTGMLSSYYPGGRASALEIQDDAKFTAEYMDQQVVLVEPAGPSLRNGAPQ
jgi:Calcineurin-like phosphoesterase